MTEKPIRHEEEVCQKCRRPTPMRLLDAKPLSLANAPATPDMISEAANRGEEFDILQCADCYGPAWSEAK